MKMRLSALAVAIFLLAGCGQQTKTGPGATSSPTAAASQEDAQVGDWKTWVLTSGSEIEVPPPPAEGSSQEKDEIEELKEEAANRTVEIKGLIDKWNDKPAFRPWTELNLELVAARPKDPVNASRGYGYVHAAIYDAMVSAYHWKAEYNRARPDGVKTAVDPEPTPSYPSAHAAIAGAASRVISHLFPERPAGLLDSLAEEAAESRVQAGVSFRSDVEAGLALGRAVADKVIARAKADGSDARWDGKRPTGRQYYRAPTGSTGGPVQPLAGTWKTWVMTSGSQFRPPPPPEYGSPKFLEEAKELIEMSKKLTPEQKRIATFWAGGEGTSLPPGVWNEVLLAYAKENNLSIPRAARVFALLNVAMSDGGIGAWDAKYAYWNPRPETAIEDLGLEPGWKSFIDTPFFPAYISGHSTYSAAAAEVMSYLYPEDKAFFQKKAEEAGISRLYGGIHWRSDNDHGLATGRKIGRLVVDRAKQDGAGD